MVPGNEDRRGPDHFYGSVPGALEDVQANYGGSVSDGVAIAVAESAATPPNSHAHGTGHVPRLIASFSSGIPIRILSGDSPSTLSAGKLLENRNSKGKCSVGQRGRSFYPANSYA